MSCTVSALVVLVALTLGPACAFSRTRFPGPYCANRTSERCCKGRQDDCTVPIHDTLCYCDEFCAKHDVKDCCPDYEPTCINLDPLNNCKDAQNKERNIGDILKKDCNKCTCVLKDGKQEWSCEADPCINDGTLVASINRRPSSYRFTAKIYSKFNGIKTRDGLSFFLGTINPKPEVLRLHPLKVQADDVFEKTFISTDKWPAYIHPAMDQGQCGASWAFSTASVAADRWSIQSQGKRIEQLSPQNLLSCNRLANECEGGRVEDAWWYLMTEGIVQDGCYPYESGETRRKGSCRYAEDISCPDGGSAYFHKTTPAYRIASNEREIMKEIKTQGPVQAIMQVRPDFFLYENGIYAHMGESVNLYGTHSVKIIGWGEENGVKFWICVNSWGRNWGDNGMFRILRGENESGIEEFIIAVWPRVERHVIQDQPTHETRRRHRYW